MSLAASDIASIWGRVLCDALGEVAPEAVPQDGWEVLVSASGRSDAGAIEVADPTILAATARAWLEVPGIETRHMQAALDAARFHLKA
jgi:hypothetical protein